MESIIGNNKKPLKANSLADIEYLMQFKLPPIEQFESAIQAFGIFKSINTKFKATEVEFAKLAVAGWLAQQVRLKDENKLLKITPFSYLQAAHKLVQAEWKLEPTSELNYNEFKTKIIL